MRTLRNVWRIPAACVMVAALVQTGSVIAQRSCVASREFYVSRRGCTRETSIKRCGDDAWLPLILSSNFYGVPARPLRCFTSCSFSWQMYSISSSPGRSRAEYEIMNGLL